MRFFYFLTLVYFFSGLEIGKAQLISTVAGNGTPGYSGNGGPATSAELYYPTSIVVDASEYLYIADFYNNCIRIVNPGGTISTFAGNGIQGYSGDGGPASSAELYWPYGVNLDGSGNIYIAEQGNSRIRIVNPSGIISTFAGNGTYGYSGDGGPATSAELWYPRGVVADAFGNVYIADFNNMRIRKVNSIGIISTFAGNGILGYSGDGGPATSAEFHEPNAVALDASGNLYIADLNNYRIRKVNKSGIISTFAGNGMPGFSGDSGQATSAKIDCPGGMAFDVYGNFYFAGPNNNHIRKVDTNGIISTVAGNGFSGYSGDGGPATSAEFREPIGVATDAVGFIYIADYYNSAIRNMLAPLGIKVLTNCSVLNLFPNPNNGVFTIQLPVFNMKSSINVYNMLGEQVYIARLNASNTRIDLRNSSNGIYLYRVLTETGDLVSEGKFIIQK